MSKTRLQVETEVLKRPTFSKFDDSTKLKALIYQAINSTCQVMFENNRTIVQPERTNAPTGLVLPAGVAWGANGKLYTLDSTTSPVLTADADRITKLWILGDSAAVAFSESTYDTDVLQGSGIPDDDDEALDATSVYHEVYGQDDNRKLVIYIGNTAAGSAPDVAFNYLVDLTLPAADGDKIPFPDALWNSKFMPELNRQLKYYVGFDY
jgi:hypothetical protein